MNSISPEIDYTTPGNGTSGRMPSPLAAGVPAWKQELNERLAATRARRKAKPAEQSALPGLEHLQSRAESRAALLAAKVAERYSQAPSYSEMLAIEARAVARAAAAAESAAQQARAAAQAILVGLDMPQHLPQEAAPAPAREEPAPPVTAETATPDAYRAREDFSSRTNREPQLRESLVREAHPASAALEDPVEEALVLPAEPLPANLIEFPRELVAARKARPRLVEGPLRESEQERAQAEPQVRIFEVPPENISTTAHADARLPEWSSIRLDARSAYAPVHEAARPADHRGAADGRDSVELPLATAPLEDRVMAGIVDLALVGIGFVLFVLVFAACTAHPPAGKPAIIGAGLVLAGLFLLYQVLFFTYSEGTPGMRYARIALCTFNDENPTRRAMRRRILSMVLSACPLGLGFAWAWFDTDRLAWHDRLTRMYQRSYR